METMKFVSYEGAQTKGNEEMKILSWRSAWQDTEDGVPFFPVRAMGEIPEVDGLKYNMIPYAKVPFSMERGTDKHG